MPSPPIYTPALTMPNHSVHHLLELHHTIHIHFLIAISKSILAIVFLHPSTGGFRFSAGHSRYTIVSQPVAVSRFWLADSFGVSVPQKEVAYA